ncbi:F-box/WD repeat-containing protein 9-like [Hydractinia symbiolongicarpus]|uniref:F-box/WD repeat-containing protein 9-like n=1 Tax=Hydractinia symbiolongicarpus TaxID=13093 RepID=UPI002550B957|nr:F-box/WD repeat-containing protein 9-like [Hydractinia symbiolongicarpus]
MADPNTLKTSLLDLPPEILLQIFSLIDIRSVYKNVIITCKHFHELLTADGIWKILFALKWNEHNIADDLDYVWDWREVCFSYEDIDQHWKCANEQTLKTAKLAGHYAVVDAVHIMKSGTICISGSRDRTALVWNLSNFLDSTSEESYIPSVSVLNGHKGWVWSIDSAESQDNIVVTTSWDKTLKVWDLSADNLLVDTFEYHPAAILGLRCHDNVYTTCCYDKTIRTFDPRSRDIVVKSCHHKRPVLCVEVTDKYILSGSEDKTIGIYDVRAGKLLASLRVDSPVLCMNIAREQGFNYLRVGGKNGGFYIFDMSNDHFTLLNSTQLWSNYKVTQLCNYSGSVAACSQNGTVRFYTPSRNCTLLQTFGFHTGDVCSAHSRRNLLATGSSDSTVRLWNVITP